MPIILLQYCYTDSLDPLSLRTESSCNFASAAEYLEHDSPDASLGSQTSASPGVSKLQTDGAKEDEFEHWAVPSLLA